MGWGCRPGVRFLSLAGCSAAGGGADPRGGGGPPDPPLVPASDRANNWSVLCVFQMRLEGKDSYDENIHYPLLVTLTRAAEGVSRTQC